MLWWLCFALLAGWVAGLVSGFTFGNFIHILFVGALVILVLQLYSRRAP